MNSSFIPAARAAAGTTGPGDVPASRRSPLPGNGGGPRGTALLETS